MNNIDDVKEKAEGHYQSLKDSGKIDDFQVSAMSAWQAMSLSQKFKWFIFNKWPFPYVGQNIRRYINLSNKLHAKIESIEGYSEDNEWGPMPDIEVPYEYRLNPEDEVIVGVALKPVSPLEFIRVDIKTQDIKWMNQKD